MLLLYAERAVAHAKTKILVPVLSSHDSRGKIKTKAHPTLRENQWKQKNITHASKTPCLTNWPVWCLLFRTPEYVVYSLSWLHAEPHHDVTFPYGCLLIDIAQTTMSSNCRMMECQNLPKSPLYHSRYIKGFWPWSLRNHSDTLIKTSIGHFDKTRFTFAISLCDKMCAKQKNSA